MDESIIKEHILSVFQFGNQLRGVERNFKANKHHVVLNEHLMKLIKNLELPLVDTSSKEVLHGCRHIVEYMVSSLLMLAKIPYQSTVFTQINWLRNLHAISKFPHSFSRKIIAWCNNADTIRPLMNTASHGASRDFPIKDVLHTIETLYSMLNVYNELYEKINQHTTNTKVICKFHINKKCTNRHCAFAHTTYI